MGYLRYVDDIPIIYNAKLADINHTLQGFNSIQPNRKFTIEKGKTKNKNFLDIAIQKQPNFRHIPKTSIHKQ